MESLLPLFLLEKGDEGGFDSFQRLNCYHKSKTIFIGSRDLRVSHDPFKDSGAIKTLLDFLAGNESYRCTPWGNPTRNVFGCKRPCYLLGRGCAPTFKALIEETDWDHYGTGNNPKCANCMAHCGYEATAVNDTIKHPLKP